MYILPWRTVCRSQVDCLVPMHINTTHMTGLMGRVVQGRSVSVCSKLAPGMTCLPGGNEVGCPAGNNEPRCKICWHGTQPCGPRLPTLTQDLQVTCLRWEKLGERTITIQEVLTCTNMEELTPTQKMQAEDQSRLRLDQPLRWSEKND